jgi:spermidine/putrescine-binding protein
MNTLVDGKPHAVPFCWGTSGLVVNKAYAPNAKDYSDLLNAFYNGRVSELVRVFWLGLKLSRQNLRRVVK